MGISSLPEENHSLHKMVLSIFKAAYTGRIDVSRFTDDGVGGLVRLRPFRRFTAGSSMGTRRPLLAFSAAAAVIAAALATDTELPASVASIKAAAAASDLTLAAATTSVAFRVAADDAAAVDETSIRCLIWMLPMKTI